MTPTTLATSVRGLTLRELNGDDLDPYVELVHANREHLYQRGDFEFEAKATRDDLARYFASPWDDNVRLGVWSAGHGLVGRVDLVPVDAPRWSIGYWLGHTATGRGWATAAAAAAIEHARTALGAEEVYAGITHGNAPSVGVVTRLGFEHLQDLPDRSRWRLVLHEGPARPPVLVP